LLGRLAEGQGLGLREVVHQEHVVMPAKRIEPSPEDDEITRDQPRSLVDQLVEGTLAIGARSAKDDGTGRV
jgi:hypothetical protein